ncbi:MAG: hypothetical protein ACE5IO_09715 [Thermoplasmata archaeon]
MIPYVSTTPEGLEQETEAAHHVRVLPRVVSPKDALTLSGLPAEGFEVFASVPVVSEITIRAVAWDIPLRVSDIRFELPSVERIYQGHGVWDTSSVLQSEDILWEKVRAALYAIVELRLTLDEIAVEAENFLLNNPALLFAFEALVPQVISTMEERGWRLKMKADLLEDPDAPEAPVVYLDVQIENYEGDNASFMKTWDDLSALFHREIRRVGESQGLEEKSIIDLGSKASLVMTRHPP